MTRAIVAFATLAVITLAPAYGAAQRGAAEDVARRARAAYDSGEFAEAAELYGRAFDLAHVPTLLYNRARALENADDAEHAIEAYTGYLEIAPDVSDRGAIEARVARLREAIDERRRLAEELEQARRRESLTSTESESDPIAAPRGPNALPWIVAGVGVMSLGGASLCGALADERNRAAQGEEIQERAVALVHERDNLATTANVVFAIGGALAIAGAVWAAIDVVDVESSHVSVAVGAGSVTVAGSF